MTTPNNVDILRRVIAKAVKGGWRPKTIFNVKEMEWRYLKNHNRWNLYLLGEDNFASLSPNDIIFSHSFAKAFWNGKTLMCDCCKLEEKDCLCSEYECQSLEIGWRHHLKRMVVSENPIKYLSKFL